MGIKPEDVRKHLEAKQGRAGAPAAAAARAAPMEAGAAAVEPARESAILESISASYFLLRRGLAVLAFAFPILLWLGAGPDHVQASISAYYHFHAGGAPQPGAGTMRDVFVGVLWAVGAFLFFYKGYSSREDWALNAAGIAALLIALLPMDWPPNPAAQPTLTGIVHQTAAVLFFLSIAFVCLFCSGDTLELVTDQTRRRRFKAVYTVLGTLMIVIPLTVVALHFLMPGPADRSPVVLLIEVGGIYVFSAFWLVKSREIAIIERP
ncbi:MAG TPA: DUF998 domain-containing protein [Allosphingosinicella sp.]|nr:DUF998 domain-containing protein [Allosphingosinicella sp.]